MRADEIQPKKLVVFDIDDTLVNTQTKVHVIKDGKVVNSLNSHDFTHYKLRPGESFDFEDFRNAREFFEKSKPIIPMMRQLKQDIATGNKVVMVTARADFDDKELFLDTFRKYGVDIDKVHVYRAGNSKQGTTEERKKAIIKHLLDKDNYSKAIMYDDAKPNLHTFIELKQDHPHTRFYAWHVSPQGEASEYMREGMVSEKRRKRRPRWAAYGPGPYGGYGYAVGYSGDSRSGGDGGVGESVKKGTNDYLWHGSKRRNDVLIPRQAKDTGGAEGSNKNAVYATPDANVAIAMGLTTPGSETGMFPNDPQMVLFKGEVRKGEMVYLHKVPKDLFIQHNSREWYSKPDVKEITPIEIKEVPVDKYLNLIRKATSKDLELRAKYTKKDVAENLNEASSDEAWELVGQPVPEIQQFVKQMGFSNDEESVEKITAIIDAAPDTQIPAASIPKLKNLANKGNDIQTLKAVQQISGKPDAEQQYTRLMQTRDAGEGRNRDVSGYLQYVKSGNYDPPVLLKISTGIYVIGGRTRLYAALALGVPAKVKIISANNFKQRVEENFADGKVKGKSRPGRVKRAGASCNGSVTDLRKRAKNASGEKAKMYHWCANMKSGRNK